MKKVMEHAYINENEVFAQKIQQVEYLKNKKVIIFL